MTIASKESEEDQRKNDALSEIMYIFSVIGKMIEYMFWLMGLMENLSLHSSSDKEFINSSSDEKDVDADTSFEGGKLFFNIYSGHEFSLMR